MIVRIDNGHRDIWIGVFPNSIPSVDARRDEMPLDRLDGTPLS